MDRLEVKKCYRAVLKYPQRLLKILAAGYQENDTPPDDKLAVKLWHNVALVALKKDWKSGRRLKKAFMEEKIYLGTMQSFSTSQLAWSMVLFKYWTKDTEIPDEEEQQQGQEAHTGVAQQQRHPLGQLQERETFQKRKPIKVCVGNHQKHMLDDYRKIRKMLKNPAATAREEDENANAHGPQTLDISKIWEGMESWDLYMNYRDRTNTSRGHNGQEDVDNKDVFTPLPGVILSPDSGGEADDDIGEEDIAPLITQQFSAV